uniref:F-box protein At2g35280-like n=1 Tax=Erigeron canadensis TaxID=72917 RepID=UPI001CB97B39|nr:F-box protein At2g35280-like [Erigeron canadensis]
MGVSRKSRNPHNDSMMSFSSRNKRVGKFVRQSKKTTFGSLPRDILVDVLAYVASDSFDNLFKAKLSCKVLLDAAKDDSIFRSISLDKFPVTPWFPLNDRVQSFLTHCFEIGNSHALFRHGMIEYFKLGKVESGLEYLKRAVRKGHSVATYVYGMILLSRGDEVSCQEGLNVLNHMKYSSHGNWNVKRCRDEIKCILDRMWIKNWFALENVDTRCQEQGHVSQFCCRGWNFDDNVKVSSCDTCMWYRELVNFCKIRNVMV